MIRPLLTLGDLATGLLSHGGRYAEIGVFADDVADVRELREGNLPAGVQPLDGTGKRFMYDHETSSFLLELSEDGVVRLRREVGESSAGATEGAIVGAIAGTAIGSALSKKGEGWAAGLLLGLLAGAAVADANDADKPRRVLTMRFDPDLRAWQAYDGGLVTWMKSEFQGVG